MRERVLLLGGTLDVTSGPEGTRIEASLPAG
jgi:signal transduction histidine kinase